ncbi:MAG: tetratricopeptide repeat protein, partial [Chloroflexi bacterium]|nr:tetratricopeptide repeat protein [Chloroflexota bacterium]
RMNELERLTQAIEHLESQRVTLGDEVVEAALIPLQEKIAELETQAGFPEQQRKQVTILFTDIVESTKVASHLDPEDTRDIFDNALQRLAKPVEQHTGHVTRFMGDGFKAVFGSPQSHENDPEQAVRAGLDILSVAQQLDGELREEWQIQDFQVRVGVNTGLVAVGGTTEAEDTLMGSAVNLATRIESAAPPGGLLISDDSYRHIRGIFDIEPLEPITAKGFDQPVPVYQVLGVKPRTLRIYKRGVEGIETRMIGRESEFKHLQNARQTAITAGQGQMITISGEAGLGKSRLLFEYQNWEEFLPEYIRLFLGRGRQDIQSQPYAMWRDMFAFRFEILDSDSNEIMLEKLETGFGEIFGTGQIGHKRTHFIGQLLGFDCSQCPSLKGVLDNPQQLREQATRYLVEYFKGLSEVDPAIVLIEDLHWVDDSSLDLINEIGFITPQISLLIVCVTRTTLFERRPSWSSEQEFHKLIKLQPLTKSESKQLVDEILQKVDQIPDALREMVISNAEGNPFYIEELLKMLFDTGVIIKGEPTWRVEPHSLAQVEVPATLTGVLQARLDSLPAAERRVLQLAAVIGKDFWDQTIHQVSEASGVFAKTDLASLTSESLQSLWDRELIFSREESAFAGTLEYSFKHVMFRDVIYETILKRERLIYHGLTADWLVAATQASARSEEYAAVIANHYLVAGSNVSASDWFYRAGMRAKAQVAMQEARDYLEQSLELLPPDDLEKRWQVLSGHDEILGILGDTEARMADDQELIKLAKKMDDDNLLAQAYYRQGYFFSSQGHYQKELQAYEKALDAAREAGNRLVETLILGLKVVCLTFLGEMDEAHETADLALKYARELDDDDTRAKTLGNVSVYYQLVDISRAVRLIEESVAILDRIGEHNIKATSMINLGYIYTQSGFYDRGENTFKRSLELAEALENPRLINYNQLNLGLTYFRLGKYQKARDFLERTLVTCREINDTFALAACQSYLGLTFEGSGDYVSADKNYNVAWETFKQIGAPGYAMDALSGMARCEIEVGQLDKARKHAQEIWDYLEEHGPQGLEFPILTFLTCANVFEQIGDEERRQESIKYGYQQMMERADKISDPEWRETFLESFPENQAIKMMSDNNLV